jgi:hypothetical protein
MGRRVAVTYSSTTPVSQRSRSSRTDDAMARAMMDANLHGPVAADARCASFDRHTVPIGIPERRLGGSACTTNSRSLLTGSEALAAAR